MPCDSAASGLIALGALIRDLGNPRANDLEGHYDALLRYARQYLESCQNCDVRCNPGPRRCGYTREATGLVRHIANDRRDEKRKKRVYQRSDRTDLKAGRLVLSRPEAGNLTWWPDPQCASELQIDGEPSPEIKDDAGALFGEMYLQIIEGAPIFSENLRRSFSGLCLSGRVAGEAATRRVLESVRFRFSVGDFDLPHLLTVHHWSASDTVSRLTFYNARTEQFDRRVTAPALVVADGDQSFLRVLARPEFQRSDVIGVIDRTIERDRLEALGMRISDLRQWYVDDTAMKSRYPTPRGINITILKKHSR